MYAVDLHTHTRFFHGFGPRPTAFDPLGARLVRATAGRRNLDAVAFTNHDYCWYPDGTGAARPARADGTGVGTTDGVGATSGASVAGRADADESRPVALPGIEVSTTHGHLLIVGPDPPEGTDPGVLSPSEAVALAHEGDCAAVLPHPFRDSSVRETDADVDAVEVNGKHPQHRDRVARLAEERDLPMVGGSDAHYPFEVGRAFTRVHAPDPSPESVVAAIRDGRVEPVVRRYPVDRLLTPVYDRIHRLKGHTD